MLSLFLCLQNIQPMFNATSNFDDKVSFEKPRVCLILAYQKRKITSYFDCKSTILYWKWPNTKCLWIFEAKDSTETDDNFVRTIVIVCISLAVLIGLVNSLLLIKSIVDTSILLILHFDMYSVNWFASDAVKLWIIILSCLLWSNATPIDSELPCDYVESINISDGFIHSNQSITFDGIVFSTKQYANISYVIEKGKRIATQKPYAMGCICQIKKCIQLCCPLGTFTNISIEELDPKNMCNNHYVESMNPKQIMDIKMHPFKSKPTDDFKYFENLPCENFISPNEIHQIDNVSIEWKFVFLYFWIYCVNSANKNRKEKFGLRMKMETRIQADILRERTLAYWSISQTRMKEQNWVFFLVFMKMMIKRTLKKTKQSMELNHTVSWWCVLPFCIFYFEKNIQFMFELWIFFVGLVMLTSVPFIIATILVYILIPQLLNLVGKCVVCYLANLGSFYIIVAFVQIKGAKEEPIDEKLCTFLGYLIYFLQRSTFAWSSVISFDLCFNFRYACCNSISVLLNKVRIFSLSRSFQGIQWRWKRCQRQKDFGYTVCLLTVWHQFWLLFATLLIQLNHYRADINHKLECMSVEFNVNNNKSYSNYLFFELPK